MFRQLLVAVISLVIGSQAHATWSLDSAASDITFVSIKAIDIAEVHRFTGMAGRISENGKAVITIRLNSVDTGIPVRDERMQALLFETNKYPAATIRTKIDMSIVNALLPGEDTRLRTEFTVELHGNEVTIDAPVAIARLSETVLLVSSTQALILNAADVELAEGIEALRKVASLPSISGAVPVSFALRFVSSQKKNQ